MELLRQDIDDTGPVTIDNAKDNQTEWLLGRGPLLQISDVKISRNFAKIIFENGKYFLVANRNCGYIQNGMDDTVVIKKDEKVLMQTGDILAITKNKYVFKVHLKSDNNKDVSPLRNGDINPNEINELSAEDKGEKSKNKENEPENINTEMKGEKSKNSSNEAKSDKTKTERVLPAWMLKAAGAKGAANTKDAKAVPKGRGKANDKNTEKEVSPPSKGKGRGKKTSPVKENGATNLSDKEEEDTKLSPAKKSPANTPPRKNRTSPTKGASRAKKDKLHDLSDDDIDDESKSTPSKKSPVKTPPRKNKRSSPAKRDKPHDVSDDDEDEAEEKFKTPKKMEVSDSDEEERSPLKKARVSPKKTGTPKPSPKLKKNNSFPVLITASDFEDSEELFPDEKKLKKRNIVSESEEEEEEEKEEEKTETDEKEEKKEKKRRDKPKRKSCPYGGGCYRKNPQHKIDEAHPGDSDYAEDDDGDEESDDEDDERPECEYGTDCYRKNPQHRRDYKHTRKPRPKRRAKTDTAKKKAAKKAKKAAGNASGDEDSYDDSFIDDDSEIEDITDDEEDIEEWVPSDDDD